MMFITYMIKESGEELFEKILALSKIDLSTECTSASFYQLFMAFGLSTSEGKDIDSQPIVVSNFSSFI